MISRKISGHFKRLPGEGKKKQSKRRLGGSVQLLVLAQVMISGLWDWLGSALSAESAGDPLPLLLPLLVHAL